MLVLTHLEICQLLSLMLHLLSQFNIFFLNISSSIRMDWNPRFPIITDWAWFWHWLGTLCRNCWLCQDLESRLNQRSMDADMNFSKNCGHGHDADKPRTRASTDLWSQLFLFYQITTISEIFPTTLTGLVESRFADLVGLFLVNTVWSSWFSFDEFYFISFTEYTSLLKGH